jgi:hypothetical protein
MNGNTSIAMSPLYVYLMSIRGKRVRTRVQEAEAE